MRGKRERGGQGRARRGAGVAALDGVAKKGTESGGRAGSASRKATEARRKRNGGGRGTGWGAAMWGPPVSDWERGVALAGPVWTVRKG